MAPSGVGALATVRDTIRRYRMLDGVGRLGVAVSGGADSLALLDLLVQLGDDGQHAAELVPFYVKQYEHVDPAPIADHLTRHYGGRLALEVCEAPADRAAARLLEAGRAPCRSCSAIRAGAIARLARGFGLDTVALGHHMTDAMATLLMNMWHEGEMDTMRPVTVRRRGGRVRIVRPLYHLPEADVKKASPVGPAGLVDCGMCSLSADSRAMNADFVNQVIGRHPGAPARMARVLEELAPVGGRRRQGDRRSG